MTSTPVLADTEIPSTICDEDIDEKFAQIIATEWPKLEGRQTPNSLAYTPGDVHLGLKAAELARRSSSRIRAMPWQAWSLERIMSKSADGTWTHPECCLIVPRQNGKSLILSIRVLYGLYKLGENIVFTAQQWETAKSLWKRTWAIVKSTPWLRELVESKTCSQGRGTIVLKSGAQVVFTTRSKDAGRGLDTVDLEIYDEAYDLTEADMAALSPTKMAAEDPQTIYTSSAVNQDQHPNGAVLAAVRERGLAGEEGLFFAEWMAPDGLDRTDHETWRWANPSFGVIQTVKKLTAELRKFSTEAGKKSFDVEYLGRGDWPKLASDVPTWTVVGRTAWHDLHDEAPALTGPVAVSIDRTMDGSLWVIAAAQRTELGRIHVEIGYYQAGTHEQILLLLLAVVAAWNPCVIATDSRSHAAVLEPHLTAAGLELIKMTTNQMATSCRAFVDDAEGAVISHSNQRALNDSVEGAVERTLPGGDFVFDKRADAIVAPLNAAQIARWGLLTFGSRVSTKTAAPKVEQSLDSIGAWSGSRGYETDVSQFDALAAGF